MFNFSVNYDAIDISDILNIYKCLMLKNNIKWFSALLNKCLLLYWVLLGI